MTDLYELAQREIPAIIRDELQRAPFILQALIEGHMDEHGPSQGVRSQSDQIGGQTDEISRSLIKGDINNVSEIRFDGSVAQLVYQSLVPYYIFLETGTEHMKARPSFTPGLLEFEQEYWQQFNERIMARMVERLNQAGS